MDRIRKTFDTLDRQTTSLLDRLNAFDAAQLEYRTEPGTWSILDVAHHLMLVEAGVVATAKSGKVKGRKKRLRQRFGHLAVKTVLKLGIRVKAPSELVEPREDISFPEVKEKWLQARSELKEIVAVASAPERGQPLFHHFVAGPLDYRDGVEFVLLHFDHHMRQISRIEKDAAFPGST